MKKEEMKKINTEHKILRGITKALGESCLKFKVLATGMEVTDKIQDLLGLQELIDDNDLLQQANSMFEQFIQILDDFIEDNNISREKTIKKHIEEMKGETEGE